MEPRTVIVTLEIETDLPLEHLQSAETWHVLHGGMLSGLNPDAWLQVKQVQVNVAKPARKKAKRAIRKKA